MTYFKRFSLTRSFKPCVTKVLILSTFLVCPGNTSEIRCFPRNQSRSLQRSKRQTFSAPILDYTKFRKDLARSKMMDRMNFPGTSLHDLYRKEQRVRKNK